MNSKKIKNILTAPPVLSLIISSLVILFLLPQTSKYRAVLKEKLDSEAKRIWFHDLDNDGYSEKITYSTHHIKGTIVAVHKNGKFIDQWNFNETMVGFFPAFGDFDNNGYSEIFLLTRKKDSIFINWFEIFEFRY